jgi:hypothetical protein
MRNTFIFQVMIVLFLAGAASALDPNLVAWYTFDEGSGTIAHDSAGGHNGTVYGGTWVAGKVGGAMSFNGTSSYIGVPSSAALNITGDITIAAWVNFARGGDYSDGSEQAIVTKCFGNGAYDNPYDFRTNANLVPALNLVRANDYTHESFGSGDSFIPLNSWHHVAVVEQGTAAYFYIDGILANTVLGGPPLTSPPVGNNYPMLIGARSNGLYLDGLMDDVRVYNRALTSTEIKDIPEPCTLLLLGLGMLTIRNKRKK